MARFDADGNHVWSTQYTPGGFGCSISHVAAAPDGSIYVAGVLSNGDIDFGGGTLSGNNEIVLAAFAPGGGHRWSFVAGPGSLRGIDASNESLVLTGYTYGAMDFGGGALGNSGGADAFVAMLRPDGSLRWGTYFGDASDQGGMGIAIDPQDGIVLAATSASDIDFGGGVLDLDGIELCLAAFDSTGTHDWSFSVAGDFGPGAGISAELDVDVGTDGRIALAGQFLGSIDLGGSNLDAYGGADVFLALFDAAGVHLSSERYGGTKTDTAHGVRFDASGNVAVAGSFYSASAEFGGATVMHSGGFGGDWFATVFDDTGTNLFREVWTGNGQYLMAARFTTTNQLLLTGGGGSGQDFGGGPLASSGLYIAVLEGNSGGGSTDAPALGRGVSLVQNSPNPFNPATTIRFSLESAVERASLVLYDTAGRRVAALLEGPLDAGSHYVVWDGRDRAGRPVASGTYFYRLEALGQVVVRRMSLIR